MKSLNETIDFFIKCPYVNVSGQWFSLLILLIFLILSQNNLIYKFRKVTPRRCTSSISVHPYLKIKPGLSKLINTSEPNYPFNGSYVHEAKALCTSATNLTLLNIILSSTKNFQRRQALRQTWTNEKYYRVYGVIKTVFLLGTVEDIKVQRKVDEESKLYGDIVQGGFIESYHNLTYKSTMGFRWATENCRNAKYVLKTDDDMVINLFVLFRNNTFNESKNNFHVFCHQQNHQIERKPDSKWFVDENQFKGLKIYPTYCGGSFVLMLNKVVPYFYESLKRTPFFWVEDALLYGIGLANLEGLTYKQLSDMQMDVDESEISMKCLNKHLQHCPIIVSMSSTISLIRRIWAKIILIYL